MKESIGDVLLVLRRARGMSQEELADAAGVTQAAMSRYEHNLREPDVDTQARLADALGVTTQFLSHRFAMHGGISADAHMRRRATAKPTDWKAVEARVNVLRMHSSYLLERVPLTPGNHVPRLDPDEVSPQEAAQLVRAQWSMPMGEVRDLTGWMESAGIVVVSEMMGTTRIDGMSQWAGDHAVVLVNADFPTDRLRLTLAHELGHLVMHTTYQDSDVEAQASAFAAEMLMPAHLIRPQLTNLSLGRLIDLKRVWGTSMQALIERAWHLGMLTKEARTALYKQLGRRGWRTSEPASDELPSETPRLARSIGSRLLEAGLSRDEVCSMIGVAPGSASPFLPPVNRARVISLREWGR